MARKLLTTDLCDAHPEAVRVLAPMLSHFGKRARFHGIIATLAVHEDNKLVRAMLEEAGRARVLVIDGGGSLRRALVGGNLAALAAKNGWAGIVVNGCVRDRVEIAAADVGVMAIASMPLKSAKNGFGTQGEPVTFGGVTFVPGEHLYADEDGVIVSSKSLE